MCYASRSICCAEFWLVSYCKRLLVHFTGSLCFARCINFDYLCVKSTGEMFCWKIICQFDMLIYDLSIYLFNQFSDFGAKLRLPKTCYWVWLVFWTKILVKLHLKSLRYDCVLPSQLVAMLGLKLHLHPDTILGAVPLSLWGLPRLWC